MSDGKPGRIAFITTPRFREANGQAVAEFVHAHLYELCRSFDLITTARTYDFIVKLLESDLSDGARDAIQNGMGLTRLRDGDLATWRETILESLHRMPGSFPGMIEVAYELVEQRLDAVIHFTDWEDKNAKPDSAVLSREANVHDVPIAHGPHSAHALIRTLKRRLLSADGTGVFKRRDQPSPQPLHGLTPSDNVLAIVAHDNMKLEMCRFVVENVDHILENYDCILATGTTGTWIRKFLLAMRRSSDVGKIRLCNSGPRGGDIQIAHAVVRGICRKIIFLQDPSVSHPHDSDIRLFEQAVLAPGIHVELATNVESAKLLIGN